LQAKQLVTSFPLDTRLKNGALFWASPKRPPTPLDFNAEDPMHFAFVMATAQLFAKIFHIALTPQVGLLICCLVLVNSVKPL
jgi:ubiquitin-activating enzyme E1-like protein 2